MIQAPAALSGFRAEWMSEVVAPPFPLAGPSTKLTPHQGDGRSNDPRYGVVIHRGFERERFMTHQENDISAKAVLNQIGSLDKSERVYLESLIRSDYERCHPDETLEDLKHRAHFSKEDKGLLRDWMALAAERARARRNEKRLIDSNIAA
jgi:hypothetical protein